jgi:SAM-dependent methyltransferase
MTEQVNNFSGRVEKKPSNLLFDHRIRQVLKELIQDIPKPRVLDYGTGAALYFFLNYLSLQQDQETVAYDPCLPENTYKDHRNMITGVTSGIWWTKDLPVNKRFDLAVCHFSLHHLDKSPEEALRELRNYSPIIAVVDYDFTKITLDQFKREFVSMLEQKELQVLFGGDWEKCFTFHSRYGLSAYKSALKKNGFRVVARESGKNIARHKLLLIGKKAESPLGVPI